MSIDVSVVIVNWDGLHFLNTCLSSLFSSLDRVDGDSEVILIDNGSTDGSVSFVEQQYPAVHIISNQENLGFSRANNQGFAVARGRYIVTLNNDTEVDARWLGEALAVLESDPSVGSCATQMRFMDRREQIHSAGIVVEASGVVRDRLQGHLVSDSESVPTQVFGPSAGAAVYRAEVIRQVGGFCDPFFAFYEDVDLAWRARRAGWRCFYVPTSIVYHVYSGTAGHGSDFKAFLLSRNRVWLLARNASLRQLARWAPVIMTYDIGVVAVTAFQRQSFAPVRGKLAALRQIRRASAGRHDFPFLPSDAFDQPRALTSVMRERRQRDLLRTEQQCQLQSS